MALRLKRDDRVRANRAAYRREVMAKWPKVAALWLTDADGGHLVRDKCYELSIQLDQDLRAGEKLRVFLNTPFHGKELSPRAPTHTIHRTPEDSGGQDSQSQSAADRTYNADAGGEDPPF